MHSARSPPLGHEPDAWGGRRGSSPRGRLRSVASARAAGVAVTVSAHRLRLDDEPVVEAAAPVVGGRGDVGDTAPRRRSAGRERLGEARREARGGRVDGGVARGDGGPRRGTTMGREDEEPSSAHGGDGNSRSSSTRGVRLAPSSSWDRRRHRALQGAPQAIHCPRRRRSSNVGMGRSPGGGMSSLTRSGPAAAEPSMRELRTPSRVYFTSAPPL